MVTCLKMIIIRRSSCWNLHRASLPFSAIPFAPLDFFPREYLRKLLSPWCLIKTSKQCAVQERLRPLIVLSTKARNSRKRITCSLVPGQGIACALGKKSMIDVSIIGRNFLAFLPWVYRFVIVPSDFLISMRQLHTFHPVRRQTEPYWFITVLQRCV